MKKNYYLGLFLAIVIFTCTGCNGTVTRNLRQDGFNYNEKDFKCSPFFPKNKEDTTYEKIKFFTDSHFINEDGKIYEISLANQYSSKENCREAQAYFSVKAIMDDQIVKGFDNKYYSLVSKDKAPAYSEISTSDSNFKMYHILLQQDNVLKVTTVNSNEGIYYTLRTDGNIYSYTIKKGERDAPPTVTSSSIVYNQNDYGEKIVDYHYAGDSSATYIKLESGKIFRMRASNLKECSKYLDIPCQYEMKEDEILFKFKDNIIAYNGKTIITNYHKYFNLSEK